MVIYEQGKFGQHSQTSKEGSKSDSGMHMRKTRYCNKFAKCPRYNKCYREWLFFLQFILLIKDCMELCTKTSESFGQLLTNLKKSLFKKFLVTQKKDLSF